MIPTAPKPIWWQAVMPQPDALNMLGVYSMQASLGIEVTAVGDDWLAGRMPVDILTGPVFCAGNDLKERGIKFPRPFDQPHIVTRLANLPQPVIVAVQGGCFTSGLELALTGDIILASESASFADTHGKFSMVPMWGMSLRLPRRVGSFKAREISFTGLPVSGREAERIGLANKCVSDDQLETVSMDMARAIAGQSRHSIFAYKELYIAQADLPLDAGLAHKVFHTKGRGTDLEERVAQGFSKKQ